MSEPELVRFFREEEADWGHKGDTEGWSPERAAIELIRELHRHVTVLNAHCDSLEGKRGSGPQQDVERLTAAMDAVEAAQEVIGLCDCIMGELPDKDPKRKWFAARDAFLRLMYPANGPVSASGSALRGSGPTPEGERRTWNDAEDVPKEVVLAFQRECENIDPDATPSYWTVASSLVVAMQALRGAATQPAGDGQ